MPTTGYAMVHVQVNIPVFIFIYLLWVYVVNKSINVTFPDTDISESTTLISTETSGSYGDSGPDGFENGNIASSAETRFIQLTLNCFNAYLTAYQAGQGLDLLSFLFYNLLRL